MQSKAVAFAVRTNVSFDASNDDNVPLPGYAISFGVREFLHIKEVINIIMLNHSTTLYSSALI